MNDTYCEYIVKRKMSSMALLARFVAIVLSTVVTLIGLMVVQIYGLIVGFFLIWLDIIIFRQTDIEYEYQFISGDLDIDVIYGRSKRKRARKFDMRTIEVLAPLNSDKLQYTHNNSGIKVLDFSSGYIDRPKYAFVIPSNEEGTLKVVFEPSENLIDAIKYVSPSKVHKY